MTTGVLDVIAFDDTKVPTDEAPPHVNEDDTLRCVECGKALTYGGRGRKPRYCDAHRKSQPSTRRSVGSNDKLAAQATEALIQVNGLVAMTLVWAQMPMTSEALRNAEDVFREQTYNALLTDPGLCKTILKAGTTSGRMSLIIAYGMLALAVGPVARFEIQERKARREAFLDADDSGE